jgi:uncharacterized protein (DUF427 family)
MSDRPVREIGPEHPITVEPLQGTVIVKAGDDVVVETARAFVLREADYAPVYYLPRDDARMDLLKRSEKTSWCPYKGEASYFSIPSLGERGLDAIWTYEHPSAPVAIILDHLAFYTDRVSIEIK